MSDPIQMTANTLRAILATPSLSHDYRRGMQAALDTLLEMESWCQALNQPAPEPVRPCKWDIMDGVCFVCGKGPEGPCIVEEERLADARARDAHQSSDCTCRSERTDRWCVVHGRDPDEALEEARDRARTESHQ